MQWDWFRGRGSHVMKKKLITPGWLGITPSCQCMSTPTARLPHKDKPQNNNLVMTTPVCQHVPLCYLVTLLFNQLHLPGPGCSHTMWTVTNMSRVRRHIKVVGTVCDSGYLVKWSHRVHWGEMEGGTAQSIATSDCGINICIMSSSVRPHPFKSAISWLR